MRVGGATSLVVVLVVTVSRATGRSDLRGGVACRSALYVARLSGLDGSEDILGLHSFGCGESEGESGEERQEESGKLHGAG